MQLPMGPTFSSDTFETGTIAAWGGVTTIIDFASQQVGEQVMDGLKPDMPKRRETVRSTTHSIKPSVVLMKNLSLRFDSWLSEGVTSIKLFMAYPGAYYSDDGQILRAMQVAGDLG